MEKSKIIKWYVAIALGLMVVVIADAMVGNPITANLANYAVAEYVQKKYPHLNLKLEKAHYTAKNSEYIVLAKSAQSGDTHFNIYYKNWEIEYDDYDSFVQNKFNTIKRLEETYQQTVIPLLAKVPGLEKNTSLVVYDGYVEMQKSPLVQLDQPFDKDLPFRPILTLKLNLENPSTTVAAELFEGAHRAMKSAGYHFDSYELFSEYQRKLVMISRVKPEDIESGHLKQLLDDGLLNKGDTGIQANISDITP